MLPRLLLAALLTLLFVAPAARGATTYCVGISCEGASKPTIDAALTAAATSPGKDLIMLGKGPFSGAWTILPSNPVDIVGPMEGARLTSTGNAGLVVANADTLIENVTVQTKAQSGAVGVDVMAAGPTLRRVGVRDVPGMAQQTGIHVRRGATLHGVWTAMAAPGSWGIVASGQPTAPLDLYDLDLEAEGGLRVWEWTTPVRMERVRVKATRTGMYVGKTPAFVAETLGVWGGVTAFEARESGGTVRHATLATAGNGGAALWAQASPLRVSDSALVGGALDVGTDTAIELRHSAFRPERVDGTVTQPGADNVDLAKSWHGMPSVAAGVLTPVAGSALIDTGTPGEVAGFDLDLRARPVDGDRDGVVRSDIGAFEAVEKTSVEPAKVTLIDPAPKVAPTPTPTPVATPVPVAPPVATPVPVAKATVTLSGLKARGLRGRATGAVKRVQVQLKRGTKCVTRRGVLRKAKTCAWLSAKGTGAWSLTFARRLPRGAYAVKVRALGADGKVVVASASKRVRRG